MYIPSIRVWVGTLLSISCTIRHGGAQVYDVIIVGSGPGGLVAAEYLSRDPNVSVLILEAGPVSLAATGGTNFPDYAQSQHLTPFDIPGEYEGMLYNAEYARYRVDWISDSNMWLGKLVGGCSSTNAALYFRPPDSYITNSQWPFLAAQLVAKMDENEMIHGHTDKPSSDGVWYTQEGYSIVSSALKAIGYTETTLNEARARNNKNKTFGHAPFAFKNGRRDSPANAFWGKMSSRGNVKLVAEATVDFIVRASGGKSAGVVYNGGIQVSLSNRGSVLMAAGALGTPKVLIQSGIGPSSQLRLLQGRNGFPGVSQPVDWVINPNVGRNLFDTNGVFASFAHPQMKSFQYSNKPSWAINQYINKNFTGPWSSSGPILISYQNYDVQGRMYEFQTTVLTAGFGDFYGRSDALTLALYVNNPESRAASGFDGNGNWRAFNEGNVYFGSDRDLAAMQSYAQLMVNAMVAQGATFLSAASDPTSVANWVAANRGSYMHHFGGSCYASSNSADSSRCADEKLRVIGMSNVFVADASAMRVGTVNPYGFIMYIGREAADQAKSIMAGSTGTGTGTGTSTGTSTGTGPGTDTGTSTGTGTGTTCSPETNNLDFVGNDLANWPSSSSQGCCPICSNTNGCNAYTWTNYNGGTCWLKTKSGVTKVNSGAVSAIMAAGTSTTGTTCSPETNNLDFVGNDLANWPSSSSQGCCPICSNTNGCNAYTWTNYNGGTCWLKTKSGATKVNSGAVSATISGNRALSCSKIEENVDYIGNDIASVPGSTAEACCAPCKSRADCKAYTWTNYNSGTCWLKSAKGTTLAHIGARSAQIIVS